MTMKSPSALFRKINYFLLLLLTTFIWCSSLAVGQGTADKKDKDDGIVPDNTPLVVIDRSIEPHTVVDQMLERYHLTIRQVIVKGEDLDELITKVDPSVPQSTFLTHVDSLYTDFKSEYLKQLEIKRSDQLAKEKRYAILPGLLILWTLLFAVSVWAEWRQLITIFAVLATITYGFTLFAYLL